MFESYVLEAEHAIGLDYEKPYLKHKKLFYKPFRNHFAASVNNKIWNNLVEIGYAKRSKPYEKNTCFYWLTRKGMKWLGRILGIKIAYIKMK